MNFYWYRPFNILKFYVYDMIFKKGLRGITDKETIHYYLYLYLKNEFYIYYMFFLNFTI